MSDFSVEKVYHQNKSQFSIIFPFSEFSSSDPMDQTFLQIIPSIISRRKKMTGFNISWVQGINSEINNIAVDDKKVIEKIFVQLHREGKIFNQTYNNQRRLWFLRTGNMVTSSIEAVEKGEILFVPEKWKKIFYNLMQNTGNWCISRPTGRNHKIPAYYCNHCNTIMVEINIPGSCSNCSSPRIFRDENNFDPLFSSSIQTLIQLGWLDHSKTLSVRYPASITVTQRHTEFFWASRMIMIGLLLGKNIPFREVVIYGPIADTRSKKKQKSRIKVNHSKDPIDEYNTDPIRFSRAILSSQRQKILLSTDRIKCGKRFKNKLWNASRYVISNINGDEDFNINPKEITCADKWILNFLNQIIEKTSDFMESYRINKAADLLYHFIWHEYCDWYIELSKIDKKNPGTKKVLKYTLFKLLQLLHPFMPLLTEEIFQKITKDNGSLLQTEYPSFNRKTVFIREFKTIEHLKKIIIETRKLKIENRMGHFKKINVYLKTESEKEKRIISSEIKYYNFLVNSTGTEIVNDFINYPRGFKRVYQNWEILIPYNSDKKRLSDLKKFKKEYSHLEDQIRNMEKKLANEDFLKKTPPSTLIQFKNTLQQSIGKREKIQKTINDIS